MKQIDKCTCIKKGKLYALCKYCQESHSQKSFGVQQEISNVRASEEVEKQKRMPVNNSSSVPYTPLTKWTYLTDRNDVLSALKGLREELFEETMMEITVQRALNRWFPILSNEVNKE